MSDRSTDERSTDVIVRRLADLESIRDLARRYAHCVWQKDVKGAIDLFSDDAVMDMGDRPPIEGRAALLAEYEATFHLSTFKPFVHNHVVELDGDRATGTVYLDLRASAEGTPMAGHGYYLDRYIRTPAGWKFEYRRLTMEEYAERHGSTT